MAAYDLNYYEELKLAQEGDLAAMFNVASYIIFGDQDSPVEPEAAELAMKYFLANAEAGDTDSMLDLGAMYLLGRGVEKDREKALEWYEKAAEHHGQRACRCIGNLYRYDNLDDGTPVPTKDPERLKKAFEWFAIGSDREEENCLYELGDYYRKGLLVDKNEKLAFKLYTKAYKICEALTENHFAFNDSYADVCLRLAECYHYGQGTDIDLQAARFYIQIARTEAKERVDSGDPYGKVVYNDVMKEWNAIMAETGF